MGDDLVDFAIMSVVGVATCPQDAVPEIKSISEYISDRKGGEGCVRDIIEQVMRSQEIWFGQELLSIKAD
jgi:3-deoxy-D-manno-octulosonate 8-phosphate phosphatase (KDO 8-P phosphatase)